VPTELEGSVFLFLPFALDPLNQKSKGQAEEEGEAETNQQRQHRTGPGELDAPAAQDPSLRSCPGPRQAEA
jgi:hypothetical protein